MIIQSPQNKYEAEILDIILEDKTLSTWSDGEKSIVYDLAVSLPKYVIFNWEDIDLVEYVNSIRICYYRNKNQIGIVVLCNCINAIFPKLKVVVAGTSDNKYLAIKDDTYSNLKSGGKNNDKVDDNTSQQRYWFRQ